MNRASLVVIISNNNNDNNINNNVSRQIFEPTLASCLRFVHIFFIYENNKRNRNYALSDPQFPLAVHPVPRSQCPFGFPLCEAVPDPRRGFLLHCGTHIICMCISRRCPHRSLWAAASPRKMSYVIWKLFMKQYARLRLPSNNNGNGGRPTLIWHTYAAIEATVRECGERGEGLPDWEWQWKWKSSNEFGYGNGNGRLRMGVN